MQGELRRLATHGERPNDAAAHANAMRATQKANQKK
jgi:hypothetical protein